MLCTQCSKDIGKEEFAERNGRKICLNCDNNNKNFFKSLDNKKFKEVLLKYQELDNFNEKNKDWLIKHIKSMLDDFAELHRNADDKASSWIKEQEKELRKLLFTLKIKTPEIVNRELILFTLVNEKTDDNLFVVFPRGDKKILDIQLKWCQIFLLYMEICTDEKINFRYSKFRKISQKISCLSPFPAIFVYEFAPKERKEEVKNTFLKSMKELSVVDVNKIHFKRSQKFLSDCCPVCQKDFNIIKSGEKNEELVSKFVSDCNDIYCSNFWNKNLNERKMSFDKEIDNVILFSLKRLFIKKEKDAKDDFNLPFIPYEFWYRGRLYFLCFSRAKKSNLNEIPTLLKISFNHDSNILARTFIDVFEYFYKNEMSKSSIDKIFQFKIELRDSPDTLIIPEVGWSTKTIEMTESSLLTLTKRNKKGIIENYGDHKRFIDNFLVKELKKWKDERIDNINDRLKRLKFLENFEEIKSITREKQHYAISFEKIPTFDDLIKNIIEAIRRKNDKTYNFDALWIFVPLSFSMCLKDSRTGEIVKDEETQKSYLRLSLLKKLLNNLVNSKINFKFSYLIVTFQHSLFMCYEEKVAEKEINESYYNTRLVNIPNLYFEVKKLDESETWEKSIKELEEEISKKGYNTTFLFFDLIKPYNPTYLLQW